MLDPITATLGGISVLSALGFRIGGFIAELQAAGHEFDDVILHLRHSQETVARLDPILRDPTLPKQLSDEYMRELRRSQNELEDIGVVIRETTDRLRNRSFFSRVRTKTVLANGEMTRLVNRLQFFNQNLSNLIAAHSARVLSLVHSTVRHTHEHTTFQSSAMAMDMGARYGQPAVAALQFTPSHQPHNPAVYVSSGGGGGGGGGYGSAANAGYSGSGGGFVGGQYQNRAYGGGAPWQYGGPAPPAYGSSLAPPPSEIRRTSSRQALSDRYAEGLKLVQKDEWA